MLKFNLGEIMGIRDLLLGGSYSQVNVEEGCVVDTNELGEYTRVVHFGLTSFINNRKLAEHNVFFTDNDFSSSLNELLCSVISPEVNRITYLLRSAIEKIETEGFLSVNMFVDLKRSILGYEIKPNCENGSYLYCTNIPSSELFGWRGLAFTTSFEFGNEVNRMIPVHWLREQGIIKEETLFIDIQTAKNVLIALQSI